jgi:FKBP-type peptidyl-prolyl cis-trans isomerase SlyD
MTSQILHFVPRPKERIAKDKVVRLRYAVFATDGGGVIEFRDDLYYLHGGYGGAFPKVEQALEGRGPEEKVELELAAEEAYGLRDPARVFNVLLQDLPPEAHRIGAKLDGEAPDGSVMPFWVTALGDGQATLDGNHPLAGKPLKFMLEVLEIRPATEAEIAAGHAFAPSAGPAYTH